jgi:hypothetical protein
MDTATDLETFDLDALDFPIRCQSKFHAPGNLSHGGPVTHYVYLPCVDGYRCQLWVSALIRLRAVECTRCHTLHYYPKQIQILEV